MIVCKVVDILNAVPVFEKLLDLSKKEKLPFRASKKLEKIIAKVQTELKDINEQRFEITKIFGKELMEPEFEMIEVDGKQIQKLDDKTNKPIPVIDEKTKKQKMKGSGNFQVEADDKENLKMFEKYMEELFNFDVELVNVFKIDGDDLSDLTCLDWEESRALDAFVDMNEIPEKEKERKKIEIKIDKKDLKKIKEKETKKDKKKKEIKETETK